MEVNEAKNGLKVHGNGWSVLPLQPNGVDGETVTEMLTYERSPLGAGLLG